MIIGSADGKYSCSVCAKVFDTKQGVKRHVEIYLDMSHPCVVCGKVFKTRNTLGHHYTKQHRNEVIAPWTMEKWEAFYVVSIKWKILYDHWFAWIASHWKKSFRFECDGWVHDQKGWWREWKVPLPRLWKNISRENKGKAPRGDSSKHDSPLHCLRKELQDAKHSCHHYTQQHPNEVMSPWTTS